MNALLQPAFACAAGVCLLALTLAAPAAASPASAAQRTALGKQVAERKLADLTGKRTPLLGDAKVTVLLFYRPGHEFSRRALDTTFDAVADLKGKSIAWVTLVSGRYDTKQAAADLSAAGLAAPSLVDAGDALYAELGVAVRPTFAILDADHKVAQWQPFLKINLRNAVVARVRRVLGEIDDAGLDKALHPAQDKQSPEARKAKQLLKMGRMLHERGKHDKAQAMVEKSVELDPKQADSHALLGDVHAALQRCKKALGSYAEALRIDPKHAAALAGKKACEAGK